MDLQHRLNLALYWDGQIQYYPKFGFIGPASKVVEINPKIKFGDLLNNIYSYIGVDKSLVDLQLICEYPDPTPWGIKYYPLQIVDEEGMDMLFCLSAQYPKILVHLYIVREPIVNYQGNNSFTSKEMAPHVQLLTQDVESPVLRTPILPCTQPFFTDKQGALGSTIWNSQTSFHAYSSMSPALQPGQSSCSTPVVSRNLLEQVGCSSSYKCGHNAGKSENMRRPEPSIGVKYSRTFGITDVLNRMVQNEAPYDAFVDALGEQSDEDSDYSTEVEDRQCNSDDDDSCCYSS